MLVSYLQHVPFEGPARIAEWADRNGWSISGARLDLGQPLPTVADFDMLFILGGPMSVNDEYRYPWLAAEKRLVLDAMAGHKPILGVCLGAQLIASALHAQVYPGEKEIGWYGVARAGLSSHSTALSRFPDTFVPLHWHGETFDLPSGAVRLAGTDACPNQAFQVVDRVVGLQFHLEATVESVDALVQNAASDITGGSFQQTAEQIRGEARARSEATWPLLVEVLEYLAARVVA
jgi:GMP synthase-like glutamine amidotransferase